MLKRPVWRRVEKVDYAASVVGITLDGLPGQGSLAMAFAQSPHSKRAAPGLGTHPASDHGRSLDQCRYRELQSMPRDLIV
jgi:hypothetical protein